MPVPLPDDASVLLQPPDADEVACVARGVISAVAPEGGLTGLQQTLVAAMFHSMTGHDVDPLALQAELAAKPYGAREFAEDMHRRNLAFRGRVVQMMVTVELVLNPLPPTVAGRVAEFAAELSVHDDLEDVLHGFADSGRRLAAIDFDRNGYLHDFDVHHLEHLHVGDGALTGPWTPVEDDPGLAARWSSLGDLTAGTLGRGVYDFYKTRGFAFPGAPGSAPPLLAQHDWVHILADYGTRVESEIEVFAFIARANDDLHAFSLLAMVVSLFETGALAAGAGLFEADRGHLSQPGMAVRFGDAQRRAALCTGSNDFMAADWFAVADKPVAVLRKELLLPPKSDEARTAGSVGPWDAEGISPFQLNAGRKLAAAEGREYTGS
ncbi:hypothetical protein KGQ19_41640 [Catenulispora sp. NL8]|uniref:Uncharacterized protein n=1 Tax=Catenulispora pinistramenti TaxID=2705254 RepID=A0ABS5L4U1_9ACTN|nr:hypothetical protein [Catenulispora pinistramenti]MBS2553377.1 hypothetical protein [Catenulispora pinistramenti]